MGTLKGRTEQAPADEKHHDGSPVFASQDEAGEAYYSVAKQYVADTDGLESVVALPAPERADHLRRIANRYREFVAQLQRDAAVGEEQFPPEPDALPF